MTVWLMFFLLVIAISFVLALRSMKDYQEIPQKAPAEYGLFLIRQPQSFDVAFLDAIRNQLLEENLIISFERLFKGSKSALTVWGPKKILEKFSSVLNLLELEDYTKDLDSESVEVWEMGVKKTNKNQENLKILSGELPDLEPEEQFFWQVVCVPSFKTQIRAALFTQNPEREKILLPVLQNLVSPSGELTKVPRPYSNSQMMNFYKWRVLGKDAKGPTLSAAGIVDLLKVV